MSTAGRTPTPWIAQGDTIFKLRAHETSVRDERGGWTKEKGMRAEGIPIARTTFENQNNAAFIALAANCHDDLVEALLKALPFVEDAERDPCFKRGVVLKHITTIRAALAKAGVA